jgi:GLPGLI family protein
MPFIKMKKYSYQFAHFFAILFFSQFSIYAQGNFEGKIVYQISYKDLPAEMKNYEAMLPKEMSIQLKGNKSRVEQNQMMGRNVVVSDMDNKNGFMEMEMGGQKLRMNISTEEFDQQQSKIENIEYMTETKNIAGYPCKKAIIKDDSGNLAMTIFYTEKIKNQAQKEFIGLKGFPLEYSMSQNGINMLMTASVVSEESVPEAIFEKSEGFQDISQADLQKMMGGRQ